MWELQNERKEREKHKKRKSRLIKYECKDLSSKNCKKKKIDEEKDEW